MDNGLSEKGRNQAKDLVEGLKKGQLPKGNRFLSSPKVRCIETLKPLAQASGCETEIEPLLDEQGSDETLRAFLRRIATIKTKVMSLEGVVYLCSHGDVLPELVEELTGIRRDLEKAEAIVLNLNQGSS